MTLRGRMETASLVVDRLPISTERLTLRRLVPDDSDALLAIYGSEEIARYQFWAPWTSEHVNSLLLSQAEIRIGDPGVPLVLAALEFDDFVGAIQLTINSIEDRQGEVGFSFRSDVGGRGLATEAVNAAMGFAFSVLELHRVFAVVDTRNKRSWKLMERIGMRREAHFVHTNLEGDSWIDDYTYAMLDFEWHARNAT